MKEKKFNSQEVQAIIAGNKTMFREVINPQPNSNINPVYVKESDCWQWATKESQRTPKFRVGQEIFVKGQESSITLKITSVKVERLQDISEEDCYKSGVGCLHGSEIADTGDYFESEYYFGELEEENDMECDCDGTIELCNKCAYGFTFLNTYNNPFDPYVEFWNSTHQKQEHKWEADPWVFVYEFDINLKK